MQELRTERDDWISRVHSGDHGGFVCHPKKLDGPKVHSGRAAVQDPNAGLPTVIEHGSQRHLGFGLGRLACQPNRYGRAERCLRVLSVQHISSFIGAGLDIGGIRQLPQMCGETMSIGPVNAGLR